MSNATEIPVVQTVTGTPVADVTVTPSAPLVDYATLYAEQKEENQRLLHVLAASRINATHPTQNGSVKHPISAERVKRMLGPAALLRMTRAEKLGTLGIDANAITDEGIKKVFGRGADSLLGQTFTNPRLRNMPS